MEEDGIKTVTSPQICCHTTLQNVTGQLYSFVFILARIICFISGSICFRNFYLFIYFFFLVLTSLWHYCNILFVSLPIPFSYEDKCLVQHWTKHNRNWRIHWPMAFTTQIMHMCLKADILNAWCKFICVQKQRNSTPAEHLPLLNIFLSLFELN